jgi:hypothetical protein
LSLWRAKIGRFWLADSSDPTATRPIRRTAIKAVNVPTWTSFRLNLPTNSHQHVWTRQRRQDQGQGKVPL